MAKSYSEKLKDPRWQRKRLEIFERDNWMCKKCEDSSKTLHVHHKEYHTGKEPWDYLNSFLETLCETCHAKEHDLIPDSHLVRKQEHRLIKEHASATDTAIQTHIDILMIRLAKGVPMEVETEILKNIIYLQNKRKEYRNG